MKSLHELFAELEAWLAHFRHHAAPEVAPAPTAPVQENPHPSVAPQVAAPAPVANPATNVASNTTILDSYRNSNPQYVDPGHGGEGNAVDTSAATLDYAKVGRGVAIPLSPGNLSKTITGCPAKVHVTLIQQTSAQGSPYEATVNGQSGKRGAEFGSTEAELAFDVEGPTVNVSVTGDNPHLTLEVR